VKAGGQVGEGKWIKVWASTQCGRVGRPVNINNVNNETLFLCHIDCQSLYLSIFGLFY